MSKLHTVKDFGNIFRAKLDGWIDSIPDFEGKCLQLVGAAEENIGQILKETQSGFDFLLEEFYKFFDVDKKVKQSEEFPTCIRGPLLRAWAVAAKDPATPIVDWLDKSGAPAGLSTDFQLQDLWPAVEPGKDDDPSLDVGTDHESFVNYSGFDEDDEAFKELLSAVTAGKLRAYPSLQSCTADLGAEPVLSRFGLIIKTKNGRVKRRIILDCKQSGLSMKTRRRFRIVLPRLTDAVRDILILMINKLPPESIEEFVLDFTDAFWAIPLAKEERRWFVGRVRGLYLVYQDTPQGSRNAPLSWCSIAALLMRLTQSLFCARREARMQIYVDDPATAVVGTAQKRDRIVVMIIVVWHTLGFGLAYAKAKRGATVNWIGGELVIAKNNVTVNIPEDRVQDLLNLTDELGKSNVTSIKDLRKFTGKAASLASLVDVLRPFISDLYGALHTDSGEMNSKAPANCIWTKQIDIARAWLKAFLSRQKGAISRTYTLSSFIGNGVTLRMRLDASPWGVGGVLYVGDNARSWFAAAYDKHDVSILGIAVGECTGQQIGEGLSQLIALRVWSRHWKRDGIILALSADNMTSLHLADSFKASSPAVNLIAREVALEIGDSRYRPSIRDHLPGIANKIADALSRKFCPDKAFTLPECLKNVTEVTVPVRDEQYYESRACRRPQCTSSETGAFS